ncbi:MAG: hypothetical protein GX780_07185 [Campylobacteraceae bacterium]|nr:hypothetical protein [Campylobacteraceae bacterium]
MRFKKQIAAVAVMGTMVATSAMAYGGNFNQRAGMGGQGVAQSFMGQRNCGLNFGNRGGNFGRKGSMLIFSQLNLTPEQAHEIQILKAEMRLERLKSTDLNSRPMLKAFGEKSFSKDAFIKASSEQSRARAEIKATYMEKLYNILTPEQRNQWVKNMESFRPRN